MNFYSYLVEHDFGLAPNPFGQFCTLTVCKPLIRKSKQLQIGDWIIGTGSKSLEKSFGGRISQKLIYAMQVSEIIPIEKYWYDSRFQYKKPIINGSFVSMYGDNFYHKDEYGNWNQENSAHSLPNGTPNVKHLNTDINGKNALIAINFYYFGDKAPFIPQTFKAVRHSGIGQKVLSEEMGNDFIGWLTNNFKAGINGRPINWPTNSQLSIF